MAPRKPAETPAPEAPAADIPTNGDAPSEAPAFDWSELAAPLVMADSPSAMTKRVNVLEDVPEPIRQRIEYSLMKTVARISANAGSTAKRPRVEPYWQVQAVPTEDRGAEFVALATRYAKYRPAEGDIPHADGDSPKGQITVRCGTIQHYRQAEAGLMPCAADAEGAFLGVRYSARPFEARKDRAKVPGTTG